MDSWINGKLNKKEDGYYIDDIWILWDWEEDVITKGIKELYKKYKFKSVLELGFGVGWTATEFQKQGVPIQVIGCGGIKSGEDVLEYILCGASAVQIGTQLWREGPNVFKRVEGEVQKWLTKKNVSHIMELQGKLKTI